MQVVDNALSTQVFAILKEQVFDPNFSWYYSTTSNYYSGENINGFSFSHFCLEENKILSNIGFECRTSLLMIADKMNIKIKNIIRARFGLLQPKSQGKYINTPHTDREVRHIVGLLYLNDSDAETVLYNENFKPEYNLNSPEYYDKILKREVSIKQKVECKENRFVMFDGYNYHSSTCPTNVNRRIVLNFNFEIEERV
jgi:hypothetical protein